MTEQEELELLELEAEAEGYGEEVVEDDGFRFYDTERGGGGAKDDRPVWQQALSPTGGKLTEDFEQKTTGGVILDATKETGLTALEMLDAPKRILGKARGYDVSDPESALLEPEAKKVEEWSKEYADKEIAKLEKELETTKPGSIKHRMKSDILRRYKERKEKGLGAGALIDTVVPEAMREAPTLFIGGTGKKAANFIKNRLRSAKAGVHAWGVKVSKMGEEGFDYIKKNPDATALKNARGKADEIAQELDDLVYKRNPKYFPEEQIVNEGMNKMPEVNLKRVTDKIDRRIKEIPLKESNAPIIRKLEKLKKDLGESRTIEARSYEIPGKTISKAQEIPGQKIVTDPGGKPVPESAAQKQIREGLGNEPKLTTEKSYTTPDRTIGEDLVTPGRKVDVPEKTIYPKTTDAKQFKKNLVALDDLIDYRDTPDVLWNKELKVIRKAMQREMIRSANKIKGAGGKEYVKAVRGMHKKLETINGLKINNGTNLESFVANLFGKNKKKQLRAVKALEDAFGVKVIDRAKLTHFADKLNEYSFVPTAGKKGKHFLGQASGHYPSTLGTQLPASPDAAKRWSNIFDEIAKQGEGAADITKLGLTATELNALKNLMGEVVEEEVPEEETAVELPALEITP